MSDTDSFIDEVNDEVRRDRLFGYLRRYGWIAALGVVLIVGGASYSEYLKAEERAKAESLGDSMLAALEAEQASVRASEMAKITSESTSGQAIANMLTAAEAQRAGDIPTAVSALQEVAANGDLPLIYRQVASFKSLTLQSETLPAEERRQQFAALATPGQPLRLLALEQLALIDIADGLPNAAIERFQTILEDADVTSDLQQRALQVIVSLGGTPELDNLPDVAN